MTTTNHMPADDAMAFETFAAAYRATFAKMMSYKLTEVGSDIYAEKLAELADAHPEWAEIVESAGTETT